MEILTLRMAGGMAPTLTYACGRVPITIPETHRGKDSGLRPESLFRLRMPDAHVAPAELRFEEALLVRENLVPANRCHRQIPYRPH